jgi:hypothetical protein
MSAHVQCQRIFWEATASSSISVRAYMHMSLSPCSPAVGAIHLHAMPSQRRGPVLELCIDTPATRRRAPPLRYLLSFPTSIVVLLAPSAPRFHLPALCRPHTRAPHGFYMRQTLLVWSPLLVIAHSRPRPRWPWRRTARGLSAPQVMYRDVPRTDPAPSSSPLRRNRRTTWQHLVSQAGILTV